MTLVVRSLLVLALATACGSAGYLVGRRDSGALEQRRVALFRSLTAGAGPGQMLVVGDSIVELQALPRLCGLATLNAGISGARARDLIRLSRGAIAIARPSRVVFAAGINDILNDSAFDLERWTADMRELTDGWAGAPIIVGITVMPGEHQPMQQRMNQALRALAASRRGLFVEGLRPADTYDGVHPTASGAAAWQERVGAACARLSAP